MTAGQVHAICISSTTGTRKHAVAAAGLLREHGVSGDAHAGPGHRQVSLLASEQIRAMQARGLHLTPGAFGENIVTEALDLDALQIGQRLRIGSAVVLEITQRGKVCHTRCAIYHQTGDCIMPRHGLFARVCLGGVVRRGDRIAVDRHGRERGQHSAAGLLRPRRAAGPG